MNKKRLGIYGGTFDPIHNTHLDIAHAAMAHAALDEVVFVVASIPPHKQHAVFAGAEDRLAMVRAAVAGEPAFSASRLELDRNGPSYTADTIAALAALYPDRELFLIVGWDSLLDLPRWHRHAEILSRAKLLAVPRPGIQPVAPASLQGRYEVLPFPESDASSTAARMAVAKGDDVSNLLPLEVDKLIKEKALYHARSKNAARQRIR